MKHEITLSKNNFIFVFCKECSSNKFNVALQFTVISNSTGLLFTVPSPNQSIYVAVRDSYLQLCIIETQLQMIPRCVTGWPLKLYRRTNITVNRSQNRVSMYIKRTSKVYLTISQKKVCFSAILIGKIPNLNDTRILSSRIYLHRIVINARL